MKERVDILLKRASSPGSVISSWEQGFLESVQRQLSSKSPRALSSKQLDIVHRVEAKVEKDLRGDSEFKAQWTDEKASDFKTACDYYNAPAEPYGIRYYSHILDWAIANPDKVPPAHYYKKVVENKYAQKIINALKMAPKYPSGAVVMLRSTARQSLSYGQWQNFKNLPLFVIEPTSRAISAAAGCRIYSLLSSTSAEMLEVEERWIKKWKTPKTPTKTNSSEDCRF
tara:strand:+ start:341 stop:1021 length:681 start_codon:yes stop_codon:yes gene_type:complete